jgi:hypothetical protein
MNKATRMLAIAGMALAAGATIGASPAMAASSTPQSSTTAAAPAPGSDRIVGFYRSYRICDRIGNIGEWSNRWDDHDCFPVRFGLHRGMWALSVSYDWHHGGGNWHHGGGDWHGNGNWHGNGGGNWHGNGGGDWHGGDHHGVSHLGS